MTTKAPEKNRERAWKTQYKKKDDIIYTYYKATGHIKETCFKLNGYPEWFNELKTEKG